MYLFLLVPYAIASIGYFRLKVNLFSYSFVLNTHIFFPAKKRYVYSPLPQNYIPIALLAKSNNILRTDPTQTTHFLILIKIY